MLRYRILNLFFLATFTAVNLFGGNKIVSQKTRQTNQPDSLFDNQALYNGKIWRNLYYLVMEDQFLFSKEYLQGIVTIKGRTFNNVQLKYDIFKDELLTPIDSGRILQINKEMIDSFSLSFQGRKYQFIKMKEDTSKLSESFYNVLYNGKTSLLLKYSKKIDKLSVEGKYDKFYQISKIFIVLNDKLYPMTGKGDLFKILPYEKSKIKDFMKTKKLRISEKEPESFIPVVRFHDRTQ